MRFSTIILFICLYSLAGPATSAYAVKCAVTATNLNFGNYDTLSPTPRDSTASINVTCNNPPKAGPNSLVAVTIAMSPGNSGNFASRELVSTSTPLNYNLYTTASFSNIWGDGAGGSTVQVGNVNKVLPWNAIIYGRIPARQNVLAGSYSDVITVTINY